MSRDIMGERISGFDWLRGAAILAVVIIHACDGVFRRNTYFPVRNGEAAFYFTLTAWMRFCVPCFFMMSAFLAEQRIHKTGEVPAVRWKRFALPLTVASVLYLLVRVAENRLQHRSESLPSLGAALLTGQVYYHLWFLYTLFVYSLLHRWLRLLASGTSFAILAGVYTLLFVALTGNLERCFTGAFSAAMTLLWAGMGYYVAGIWAAHNVAKLQNVAPICGPVLFVMGLVVSCGYGVLLREHSFYNPGAELLTAGVLLWSLRVSAPPPVPVGRIAALSLGIYLWHPLFLLLARLIEGRYYYAASRPASFALMLFEILTAFAGSALLSAALARTARLRFVVQ